MTRTTSLPPSTNELLQTIRNAVLGHHQPIYTAFGKKPLVYADYTASGRSLGFIEDLIRQRVLPFYANTHTETTLTGATTTAWRESARATIRRAVNGSEQDKVIFCGSGATAAVNKLIDLLNLRLPAENTLRTALLKAVDARPVVFIGPYEHHSNELPWRESLARVEVIPLNHEGSIDMHELERRLQHHVGQVPLIGSFSAASNVTGIRTDVAAVTALLKRYGALACWDYAAAGPYVAIDMQPLDAVFLSPHKFVGGPGTPGVLIAKQHLFKNPVPVVIGGGTVSYVSPDDHVYVQDVERREEGGTPAIVESIRAGLVFSLQQQVGIDTIQHLEHGLSRRAMQRLKNIVGIEVLGSETCDRLPIFSLRFHSGGKELHYGFVVSLLNDLFGIQVRGGCSCAGPYAHTLLGMSRSYSKRIESAVTAGVGVLRPGWVRLNFNYFMADTEFEYVLAALELVAEHGWRVLPAYRYDASRGVWRHRDARDHDVDPMQHLDWHKMGVVDMPGTADADLDAALQQAREQLLHCAEACSESAPGFEGLPLSLAPELQDLCWFLTPDQAARDCRQASCNEL